MTLRAKNAFIPWPGKPRYRLLISLWGDKWLCYEISLGNDWQFNHRGATIFLT